MTKQRRFRCCIVMLLMLPLATVGRGAETNAPAAGTRGEPATIDAKQLRFDQTSNMAYGEGAVVVRYKGAVLQADRVRYNRQTQEAWAEGHVRLTHDGREWTAPAAYYNFESTEMRAENVRGFSDGVTLWIDSISEAGTNHYFTTQTALSTCDHEPPHYRLEATHAEIWPDGRIELHNVVMKLGEVPIFWFPMFSLTDGTGV